MPALGRGRLRGDGDLELRVKVEEASVGTEHKAIAKITNTMLGYEGHGILTASLCVDYGGSGQWIGNYAFDEPVWEGGAKHQGEFLGRFGTAYGMQFIQRLLKACGVDKWEDIKGRTIYVLKEDDRWNAKVIGIENLPTEPGERFLFSDLDHLVEEAA